MVRGRGVLGDLDRTVVKNHELGWAQREGCVSVPLVVIELDLVRIAVEHFNNRSDLTTNQSALREITGQGDDIKQLGGVGHCDTLRQAT